jgi:hypothetical protein
MTRQNSATTLVATHFRFTTNDIEDLIRKHYELPIDAEFTWGITGKAGLLYVIAHLSEEAQLKYHNHKEYQC